MSAKDPYVTIERTVVDDERLADIYPDNAAFGAYVKLLIAANAAWPASAELPSWCPAEVIAMLEKVAVVNVTGDRFRVLEMDSKRIANRERASAAGKASGESGRWKDNPSFVANIPTPQQPVPPGTACSHGNLPTHLPAHRNAYPTAGNFRGR